MHANTVLLRILKIISFVKKRPSYLIKMYEVVWPTGCHFFMLPFGNTVHTYVNYSPATQLISRCFAFVVVR